MSNNPSSRSRGAAPCALTIAGSDSCGGAGIQADLKTFSAWQVEGASVITAITAQNTAGVSQAKALSAELVAAQLEAVLVDLDIGAAKTGMLANAAIIEAVAEVFGGHEQMPLVVDPVMVATSGARLLDSAAESVLIERLLPRAALITPNLPEAAVLSGLAADAEPERLAEALLRKGCRAVLLKGGHGHGRTVEDWLYTPDTRRCFEHRRIDAQVHGTGCTLSAAITAALARGLELEAAVADAIEWLHQLIAGHWYTRLGKLAMLPFARRRLDPRL